jgi:L-asparaginase
VYTRRFSRIRSNDASVDFWLRLRRAILDTIADDPHIAGIVVAHGTATLEETAYFLHLTVPTEVPIVLVGAQRPPTAMGSDAQLNLANAVRVAASPASIGHGVLVAMDDEILSARDVTKSDNHRLHTFQARDHGRLGDIDPYGEVWFYRKLLRRHTTGSQFAAELDGYDTPLPRVDLVTMYSGSDELALTAALANGARGVVIASLPPSMNPTAVDAAIDAAIAAGITIVQSSRASSGRVVQRHGFDARGVIASDTLSPQAARQSMSKSRAAWGERPLPPRDHRRLRHLLSRGGGRARAGTGGGTRTHTSQAHQLLPKRTSAPGTPGANVRTGNSCAWRRGIAARRRPARASAVRRALLWGCRPRSPAR